jgi:hypothetical protein
MKKTMVIFAVFVSALLAAFSCFALTPQEVVELKRAGISDRTIQLMIKQEEAARNPKETKHIKEVKDKNGNTVTIYITTKNTAVCADDEEVKKAEKAWEILRNIVIDKRKEQQR